MRILVLAIALSLPATTQAAFVWGADASSNLVGSLDYTQVVATGAWEDSFKVSWEVTFDGAWKYTYCVTGDKDLSHFVLEVTKDCNIEIFSNTPHEGPRYFGDIYGVKLEGFDECQEACFTLTTDRAPVFGNFFAKSGRGTYAYNTDCNFIVRPDGNTIPTPEPMTFALFGAGIALTAIRRKR